VSKTTNCDRCGKLCLTGDGSPSARIYRRGKKGQCTECHAVKILKSIDEMHGGSFFKDGPSCLRMAHVQQQFSAVMAAGNAECDPATVDWERVIAVWDIVQDKPRPLF
jgi:hypothetical protein